jgi:hypothetical protein
VRPGQPCTIRRQASGTPLAPSMAPTTPPAIAATVSVSFPPRTARSSTSCTPDPCVTADQAPCSAAPAQPFFGKSAGRPSSASSIRLDQYSRRSRGSAPSPSRRRGSPVMIAERMARVHSTQASPASGSAWVSALTRRAATTRLGRSSRCASATGVVRIREPLPAECGRAAANARAASVSASAVRSVAASQTARVWLPTSGASVDQSIHAAAISSSAAPSSGTPRATTRRIGTAMEVSSVHSPGAHSNDPPPRMRTGTSCCSGGPNS